MEAAEAAVKEAGRARGDGESDTRVQLHGLQRLAEELGGGVRRQVEAGREAARRQDRLQPGCSPACHVHCPTLHDALLHCTALHASLHAACILRPVCLKHYRPVPAPK
jgi:hypothetical protein